MMELVNAQVMYPQGMDKVVNVQKEGLSVRFYAPTKHAGWRYKTMFIKEPETIEWLRALGPDDVLWDVGANVGIYSIYAALVTGCRVVAIEPGAANYWTLCKNIELNRLDEKVTALCIALGDEHKCADLYLYTSDSGGAQNALDRPQDDRGNPFKPQFRQGMLSIPADILAGELGVPQPTAIKIDVDGFELHVLRGAVRTFAESALKRISLEMDSANAELVKTASALLEEVGFAKTGEHRSPYVAANSPIHNFPFERA
jgi:FkbM family methyltransferase